MLIQSRSDSVKVFEVKSHADQLMVAEGLVRADDLLGHNRADAAANSGKLRQNAAVINARRGGPFRFGVNVILL